MGKSPPMKVVFDTNVFRDIQRGTITPADVRRASKRLASGDEGFLSPLALIELGSHINDDEKADFDRYHGALKAAVNLCRYALTDPEAILREQVFKVPPDSGRLAATETLDICQRIAAATSYNDLVTGQVMQWEGALARVSYNAECLKNFREDYEAEYVIEMHNSVVGLVCPDWKTKRAAAKMANIDDPEIRNKVVAFLDSLEFQNSFYKLQAERAGVTLIGESMWDNDAFGRMKYFFEAYRWILKAIVQSGYNPEKNKNDYNDVHYLLYLADPNMVLVSRDGGIARKVAHSSRVMTFADWLAS